MLISITKNEDGIAMAGKTEIIAFANQKGGVGKTTCAVNFAACLGKAGKNTLLIDFDPQGNATSALGVSKRNVRISTYDIVAQGADINSAIIKTKFTGLSLVPANINLAAAEIELSDTSGREELLRKAIEQIRGSYDCIVIDCPPSLGVLTINALTAACGVIVPMVCEYFALEGLSQLTFTLERIRRSYNPPLKIYGVMLTMYDGRLNLTSQVVAELKKHFSDKLFSVAIPRNVRLSEAPSHGQPIIYYDKFSKGADAFTRVTAEAAARIWG